ncbi:methyltransferase family protein [Sporolactobacillus sp. KGMB 08714]|uniref:methyltransferase family protein n=1 Tax=Sporolactobacillus sp. KGMB 08714 TaxID=3064704 RepID=UPI002FBEFA38
MAIIGFLIQWPTLITLIMAPTPTLLIMYRRLAKREEQIMIHEFGGDYLEYMKKVPGFVPRIHFPGFTKREQTKGS